MGLRNDALVLLESPAAVDAVPVQDAVERIEKRQAVLLARDALCSMPVPVKLVEGTQRQRIDQRHRRCDRHRQCLAVRPVECATVGMVATEIYAASGLCAACQAVDPGDGIFMLEVKFAGELEKLVQSGKALLRDIDLPRTYRHQLQLDPGDDARQAKAADGGAKQLGIFSGTAT